MNRPTKKFIAFSTALVSMIGLMAPMSAAAGYEAELMEKCEYDELIEMRDKAILIKNGTDSAVTDDTQLVVIDSNGEKKLISKEEGLNSIYNYVTTTRDLYNFISPTNDPYSFDFFDANYRISTESGVIIAGFNDKFALMDASGKKLSAEYDAIYRISDEYFMVDVINSNKRSTGLIKSDGSVIAAPAEGIGEFYLCGNKFLVSNYKNEIIETEDSFGELITQEETVYTYRFMGLDGKTETETFKSFEEMGHNVNVPSNNASDREHFKTEFRYDVDYAFEHNCIALKCEDDKQVIYNGKTGKFSSKYDSVESISESKFIVSHDDVYDVVDEEFKPLIEGAEYMSFYRILEVKKDGKFTMYDTDLNVLHESDVTKEFPKFSNATVETNGNIVTVTSNKEPEWAPSVLNTEYETISVDVEITPVWENSDVNVSLYYDYMSDFDFQIEVLEEYYDDAMGYTVTTSNRYKYVLDSLYKPHDVSGYAKVSENINHDVVVLQKEDGYLEYMNFADANDKKDLSAYKYLTPVDNHILGNSYYSEREQIGYCLKTEDSFVVSDMNFNLLTEPVKGIPSAVKISCKDNVYSGAVEFYVNAGTDSNSVNKYGVMSLEKGVVIPAVYDSVSVGYGGYLVTQNGQTTVMNENGEAVKEFDGAYSFNSITGCVYDADWNLVKRDNDVTSTIVYNIENDEIKYQQTGKYDEVSYFVDGYAQVVKYTENPESDDLWSSRYENFYGIISINGTEVVKPSDSLYITMNADFTEGDTSFWISADSKTEGKDRSNITLSVQELDEGYINANKMTVAKKTGENSYLALVNGLWGVYDGEGKEIIKPQFDLFSAFTEDGLSIVETPEYNTCYAYNAYRKEYEQTVMYKTGIIDIDGNIIVEPYNNIPEDGVKVQSTRSSKTPYALKTVIMDDYGIHMCKLVNGKPKYTTITADDVLNEFAKTNGYDSAHKEGDLYYVEKDGLSGVVSENNDVIIPVEYFEILSYRPSDINLTYVRPELHDILIEEFSSKLNEVSEESQLIYVKTVDGKVGVYNLTATADETEGVKGDANKDGKVNVRDAAAIATALAKGTADTLPESADYNEDGKINVRDAAAIATALAKGEIK